MVNDRAGFVRLMDLPDQWAAAANMPAPMVFRRICEWAVVGAFPPGGLITATGEEIPPLELFMNYKAIMNDGHVYVGELTRIYDPYESIHFLKRILVPVSDVLIFCDRTKTLPPPSLLGGLRRWWVGRRQDKHIAPPACPEAEAEAGRLVAHESALSGMNSLRSMLDGLQGKPTLFGPRLEDPCERPDFNFWRPRWEKKRGYVVNRIEKAEDADLQRMLADLDEEWAGLVGPDSDDPAPSEKFSEIQDNSCSASSAPGERVKKRGRPGGSGYKATDIPLVEEMREAILADQTLSITAAAHLVADRAEGGGTLKSRATRLAGIYSDKYRV